MAAIRSQIVRASAPPPRSVTTHTRQQRQRGRPAAGSRTLERRLSRAQENRPGRRRRQHDEDVVAEQGRGREDPPLALARRGRRTEARRPSAPGSAQPLGGAAKARGSVWLMIAAVARWPAPPRCPAAVPRSTVGAQALQRDQRPSARRRSRPSVVGGARGGQHGRLGRHRRPAGACSTTRSLRRPASRLNQGCSRRSRLARHGVGGAARRGRWRSKPDQVGEAGVARASARRRRGVHCTPTVAGADGLQQDGRRSAAARARWRRCARPRRPGRRGGPAVSLLKATPTGPRPAAAPATGRRPAPAPAGPGWTCDPGASPQPHAPHLDAAQPLRIGEDRAHGVAGRARRRDRRRPASRMACSARRARLTRLFTVPTAQPQISAASS